ncbi:MAG: RagB/SusD family nutrient uptake outer membrane protein, partial [Cyclobacteriaceae bacterium]|nr:RagB/SusD family nutrient uptake outer membrane protein [Cyclobacteriaceae bacterium]
MKNYIYKSIAVMFLALLGSSCEDFLVEEPKEDLGPGEIFGTEAGVTVGVNGVYESLYQIWRNREHYMVCDLTTDDMDYQGGNSRRIEYNLQTQTPNNSRIERNWDRHYDGINRANTMIEGIPGADLNEEFKNQKLGEVLFLRANYYFDLVRIYGNVPLVMTPSQAEDDFYISNTPARETFDQLIIDFETAMGLLPNQDEWTGIDVGRVGKGTAAAFLAKAYLTRASYSQLSGDRQPSDLGGSTSDYATAANLLERIIDGEMGSYGLLADPNAFYLQENEGGIESLLDVQMLDDFKSGWPATNWNEDPNPFSVPGERGGFDNFMLTQDLLDSFEPGDKRLDIIYYGDYTDGEGTVYQTEENERFMGQDPMVFQIWTTKMLDPGCPIANNGCSNYAISRYSDVLLMF